MSNSEPAAAECDNRNGEPEGARSPKDSLSADELQTSSADGHNTRPDLESASPKTDAPGSEQACDGQSDCTNHPDSESAGVAASGLQSEEKQPTDEITSVPVTDGPEEANAGQQKEESDELQPDATGSTPAEQEQHQGRRTFSKIHVSHILDEVLEETAEVASFPEDKKRKLRYPIAIDILLGAGLLVTVGGFTLGLFHFYLVHAATDSINKGNYEASIAILRSVPLAQIFSPPGSDTAELMSQALYLDSLEKIRNGDPQLAIQQLRLIKPESKFFAQANHLIDDCTEPADVLLEGTAEHVETQAVEEKKSAFQKAVEDEN